MPELPEVETIRRGLEPLVVGHKIVRVILRTDTLRWPIPKQLATVLRGQVIKAVERRAKYLLLHCPAGRIILHLGMSGSLRIVAKTKPHCKHDHADIILANNTCLRFRDPRRFGALLWAAHDPVQHPLLADLGPEPLSRALDGDYLYLRSRGRRVSIKQFIMDSRIVAGIGNIYASEALFAARIHPATKAGRISRARYRRLAAAIKKILKSAIAAGGTTVRDFLNASGNPGYFRYKLRAYGRAGEPCSVCGTAIRSMRSGQRSTFYCPHCQK